MTRKHKQFLLRRKIAEQARECVDWLKVNKFEVLLVLKGSFHARIIIKPSSLCMLLDGVVDAYERTPRGGRRYNYVSRYDCMVEWEAA